MLRLALLACVYVTGPTFLSQGLEKDTSSSLNERTPKLNSEIPTRGQDDKKQGTELGDVSLHELTIVVQRVTKKTFLWTDGLGLRDKRVHCSTDQTILNDPDLLVKLYETLLEISDLTLLPQGEGVFKITPKAAMEKGAKVRKDFRAILRGTMPCTSDPKRSLAFISSTVGNMDLVAFMDEPIADGGKLCDEFAGWRLVEVYKGKAIFSDGIQRQELTLKP